MEIICKRNEDSIDEVYYNAEVEKLTDIAFFLNKERFNKGYIDADILKHPYFDAQDSPSIISTHLICPSCQTEINDYEQFRDHFEVVLIHRNLEVFQVIVTVKMTEEMPSLTHSEISHLSVRLEMDKDMVNLHNVILSALVHWIQPVRDNILYISIYHIPINSLKKADFLNERHIFINEDFQDALDELKSASGSNPIKLPFINSDTN